MESQAQTCLVRRCILKLTWILWRASRRPCVTDRNMMMSLQRSRDAPGCERHTGPLERSRKHRLTQTETNLMKSLSCKEICKTYSTRRKKSYCFMGYMMESLHQTVAVRITVPLSGRAFPPAAIGRDTSSRCLSLLPIGCRGLTGRRRSAPCAWEKNPLQK